MNKVFAFLLLLISTQGYGQNGVIWYDAIPVADKTYGNLHPRVILDKSYAPLILWADASGRAFVAKWMGKGFAEPLQINTPGKYVFSESWTGPEITNHGDTIYIVYKQLPEDKNPVSLKHSYDGGKTFSIETAVDDSDAYISRFPSVAINPYGQPLVAYMKLDAGYRNPRYVVAKSTDLGESFAGETVVTDFSGGQVSDCSPATVIESGNATVILYRDNFGDNRNIWAGISSNTAISFNKGLQVDKSNWIARECPAHPPRGIIISDTLYSVYMSAPGDSPLVYFSKASISGMSASANPITGHFTGLVSQNYPCIANSGNAAAIAWEQEVGTNKQLCFLFTNEINNGFPEKYDRITTGMAGHADVTLGGGHIYLVWQDDSSGNIMCRVGSYKETMANKLLAENTTIYLQPSKSGKYFTVSHPDVINCLMVDIEGKEYEMDVKCKKNSCRISTEELDPGMYIVRIFCKDEKVYNYKYEVKPEKEKVEKEKN